MLATAILLTAPVANAKSSYMTSFTNAYPAADGSRIDNCLLCHANANPSSNSSRNAYGAAWKSAGDSFTAIENQDSDGDGFLNKTEITAFTYPGNVADKPEGEVPVEGEMVTTQDLAILLQAQFDSADTNADSQLSFDEVLAVSSGATRPQFDEIDANKDGFLGKEELETFLGGGNGCFGNCRKDFRSAANAKRILGDWLLIGLSTLALLSLTGKQR